MVCEMLVQSETTGISYQTEDVVHFRNPKQSHFYLSHQAQLVDIFAGGEEKIVFVFWRSEHEHLIKLWNENKNKSGE